MKKVAIGMSGGVDSSVAAALLKKQGYDVVGVFMRFWSDPAFESAENKCCSLEAFNDARKVCQQLGIPLYTLNLKQSFKKYIVDNFLEQYSSGLTPNPCVRCNQFIKFGEFHKKAKALGCDYISTGHYVRLKKGSNGYELHQGKDPSKDQSYFLYRLNQDVLKHCIFPIGEFKKTHVRKLAEKFKLQVATKRDSQEVCFVPPKDHYSFLAKYLKMKSGNIVDLEGKILGEHQGLPLYTIGQRKGLDIGGEGPYYVVKLDFKTNNLIVCNDNNHPALLNDTMDLKDLSWTNKVPKLPASFEIRIRHMHKGEKGTLKKIKNDHYQVKFKNQQRAITPGQSAVFYSRGRVVGGGIII